MTNLFTILAESIQYEFIINALIVGSFVGISCSLLGIFLVLKRFAMIGDGLAHVSFATIAFSILLVKSSFLVSIPLVVLAAFAILKLNEKANIYGDTAIGLVSSFAIAAGVMIASLSKGFNVDILSYLFGSILVIGKIEIIASISLSILLIIFFVLFYNNLFAVTYDEDFATVIGIKTKFINYLIAAMTAVTISIGIRVVGTLLISSMIIFPTVSALQFKKGFKGTIVISILISLACVIAGVFSSFVFNLPTGSTIVILNAIIMMICFISKRV